jgi:hypothetical protein
MKYLYLVISIALLACGKPTTENQISLSSSDTSATTSQADHNVPHEHTSPPDGIFVGLAKPLTETGEFYVAVFHVDNHTELNHNEFDSMVFEDQGYVRKSLSMEIARKYFYLDGMDKLRVYNDMHGYLNTYHLNRIELISTEISSEYAAVYEAPPSMMNEEGWFYCVTEGAERNFVEDFATQQSSNVEFGKEIINALQLDSSKQWVINHYHSMPGITLSTLSTDSESLLVQSDLDKPVVLSRMDNGYQFAKILQLPLMYNDKPLIIVHYILPESDDYGDYVMKFTGEIYEGLNYSRVKL